MKVSETEMPVPMSVNEGSGLFVTGDGGTYGSLPDKPRVNGVELVGDVSLGELGIGAISLEDIAIMFKEW